MARITSNEKGILTKTNLPLHDCNEEDFAEFYPIRDRDAETFDILTAGSNSSFKCIDWKDSLSLKSRNIQNIEFVHTSCHAWLPWQGIEWESDEYYEMLPKECGIIEGENVKFGDYFNRLIYEYMKSQTYEFVIYYNDEAFKTEEYNEESIKKESKLAFSQTGYNWMVGGLKIDFEL